MINVDPDDRRLRSSVPSVHQKFETVVNSKRERYKTDSTDVHLIRSEIGGEKREKVPSRRKSRSNDVSGNVARENYC